MPEPENLKVEDLSKRSNRHLTQVTGCTAERYCLLHVLIQWPRSFPDRSTFPYDVRLRSYGASNLPNFRILAFVGGTCAPPSALLVQFISPSQKRVSMQRRCSSVCLFVCLSSPPRSGRHQGCHRCFLTVLNLTTVKFIFVAGAYSWRHKRATLACYVFVRYSLVYFTATVRV